MSLTERNDLEKYFEWWLNELMDHGYVRSWSRESERISLFPPYNALRMKYFKTKEPEHEQFSIMRSLVYHFDYEIVWNDISKDVFFQRADFSDPGTPAIFHYRDVYFISHWDRERKCDFSYVDVKPPLVGSYGGQNNSYHTFPLKQQIILWMHGLYINKVIPFPMRGTGKTISLFPNTFTPHRFLITDGGGQNRKIRYPIILLREFLEKRRAEIRETEKLMEKFYNTDDTRQNKDLFGNGTT